MAAEVGAHVSWIIARLVSEALDHCLRVLEDPQLIMLLKHVKFGEMVIFGTIGWQ